MSEEKKKGMEIPKPWRIKRYYVYILATVVAVGLPWIHINGHQFFMLSFDKMKLDLAFVEFDMQQLYLMPFLLMLMFITIFGMTVMGGRVFCGWVCPQTVFRVIYRDLIETRLLHLRKRIGNKQKDPDMSLPENKVKKGIAVLIWTMLALLAGADFMWYFIPPETFFQYLQHPAEHGTMLGFVLGIAAFLIYDIILLKENFCIYVCPYSRVQSVLYDEHTVMALYDEHRGGKIYEDDHGKHTKLVHNQKELKAIDPEGECTTCEKCVTVCPTHIDIRQGLQLECINCLECVDACTTVMGKLGKPSLVTWSSDYEIVERKGKTKYFRPKILGYMGILLILMVALAYMSSTKEHMLLNINKGTRLYDLKSMPNHKFKVENSYVFLFQNTEGSSLKYYFSVIAPKNIHGTIKIMKPSRPFRVVPNVKKKKIVTLYTTDVLVDNKMKDVLIPIKIHAYAVDKNGKPDKIISIYRETTFAFPKENILNAAIK